MSSRLATIFLVQSSLAIHKRVPTMSGKTISAGKKVNADIRNRYLTPFRSLRINNG